MWRNLMKENWKSIEPILGEEKLMAAVTLGEQWEKEEHHYKCG